MLNWLYRMVNIFIGISDDNNDRTGLDGKGKPYDKVKSRVPVPCQHCHEIPEMVYRFNAAWLCANCFTIQAKHFPNVIPTDEGINKKSKGAV